MVFTKNKESDSLISMKKIMTATDVARNFSEVLSAVEAGDEIEITRGKKVIAVMKPEGNGKNGAALIKAFQERRDKYGPMDDETYAIYQQVLDDRHAPHNMVGGELYRDPWAE